MMWFVEKDKLNRSPPSLVYDLDAPVEEGVSYKEIYAATKKKYKPVAIKVRPLKTQVPEHFRIERHILGDPLAGMPVLNYADIPPFVPTGRYTEERAREFETRHRARGFLLEEEIRLVHHFMMSFQDAFAWTDDERGTFKEEYFPPIEFPVVPHTPWIERNIPIPPGIYNEVCDIIRKKIAAGVYEPSNATYRSRWFAVTKADGKSLRLVHSLEQLNKVTIQHSGVPPPPEHLAERLGGRACGGLLDLYVGYDNRTISSTSRDMTTFQTPFGTLRLTTLPMGWTNSVPIFHEDVTHILQPEIPDRTVPYIDDIPVRGPASRYETADGDYERIPENPGVRRFVKEHFESLCPIVQRMRYAGGTFSGKKSVIIADETTPLGHRCTYKGREPLEDRVAVIRNWGPCASLTDVRAFLGTVGVMRIFIPGFAKRAHHLVKLTRKDVEFEWGTEQEEAMADLKQAVLESPALRAIDYDSDAPVIVAVDTSQIAVGYYLAQQDIHNPRIRYFNRFGSITLNEREARFSQAKLELYGLYRALRALRFWLLGVRNLIIEVDAQYIKGMLKNPDVAPSASINRWILDILTFHFELRHVPGKAHGPDGLSRRVPQPGDVPVDDDGAEFEDWIDRLYGLVHILNPRPRFSEEGRGDTTVAALALPILGEAAAGPPPRPDWPPPEAEDDEEDPQDPATRLKDDLEVYGGFPRTARAQDIEARLPAVCRYLEEQTLPADWNAEQRLRFTRFANQFFLVGERLWRKDQFGEHKAYVAAGDRLRVLRAAHDALGHRGYHATYVQVALRYWWPEFQKDIQYFVRTCDLCQFRQQRHILIPPTVAQPAPLFARVYMDTMRLPKSGRFNALVQARCSVSAMPEFRCLHVENAKTLGDFIFQDIMCRWGAISEIITDNGAAFVKAMDYIARRYHVRHARISGYNSRANGLVEHAHWDVRQVLYKAADGVASKWSTVVHEVFWAERITPRKRIGCSPYFAATGTHPIIPLDLVEATWLRPPPDSFMSTEDYLADRAIALMKRPQDLARLRDAVLEARIKAARRFELKHMHTIRDFDFKPGNLVLRRNTAIEKSLNRKMRARYEGPLVVVARNRGGAYILCTLDGAVYDRPCAAFRLVPYFARRHIEIPEGILDVPREVLDQMEEDDSLGDDDYDPDFATSDDEDVENINQEIDDTLDQLEE